MATQSITSAATPTMKPTMMIQPGEMGEKLMRWTFMQKSGISHFWGF